MLQSCRPEDILPAPRMLILDDSGDFCTALELALSDPKSVMGRLDCSISVATNLEQALPYLRADSIDIYFVDLEIAKRSDSSPDLSVGQRFVRTASRRTNAGVIVCTNHAQRVDEVELREKGADDFIEKTHSARAITGRTLSVWRRVLQTRAAGSQSAKLAHAGRAFRLGDWHFVVGDRRLKDLSGVRPPVQISPTEHSFLQYVCVIDDHMINGDILNGEVLERHPSEPQVRLDNFKYQLEKKLSHGIKIDSEGKGWYRLRDVQEVKPQL